MATAVPTAVESAAVAERPAVMSTEPTVPAAGVMMPRVAVMTAGLMLASAAMAGVMVTAAERLAGGITVRQSAAVWASAAASESDPGGDQQGGQHDQQSKNCQRCHRRNLSSCAVGCGR